MIIYSGFWAGFISGVFVGFVAIIVIATISNISIARNKATEQAFKYMNKIHEAAKNKTIEIKEKESKKTDDSNT